MKVLCITVLATLAFGVSNASADDFICRQSVCPGTPRSDFIEGDDHANTIRGLAGADHIFGGRGWDTLEGGPGWDELDGGRGQDLIKGGRGDDILTATHDRGKPDALVCGGGYDVVEYRLGVDTLLDPWRCEEQIAQ